MIGLLFPGESLYSGDAYMCLLGMCNIGCGKTCRISPMYKMVLCEELEPDWVSTTTEMGITETCDDSHRPYSDIVENTHWVVYSSASQDSLMDVR